MSDFIKNLSNRQPAFHWLVIFLGTFAAYSNIFGNQFVMDDHDFITGWPLIQDWNNFFRFFVHYIPPDGQGGIYSPFKTIIHAVNYHLFGQNPFGYHVVSLLIHAAGIIFVYRICKQLTLSLPVSFASAFFFGIHPVQTEAITYMTASVDMAGVVFLFASFFFYLKSNQGDPLNPSAFSNRRFYFWSLFFAFLSIFTHELAVSLPLLFLWYELCLNLHKQNWSGLARRMMPFFMITFGYVVAKYVVLNTITRGGYLYDSFYWTMLVMIKAIAQYVVLVIFPWRLTVNHTISDGIFSYDQDDFNRGAVLSQSILDSQVLLSLGLIAVAGYTALHYYKRKPLVTFLIGWFFISLLPTMNIIPSGIYFGERYLYPGLWAFCLLVALLFNHAFSEIKPRWVSAGLVVALIMFYGARTWLRNRDWKDEISIYQAIVRDSPQSAFMNRDLGIVYLEHNQPFQAIDHLGKAARLKPDNPYILFSLAEGYTDLQEYDKAKDALLKAIAAQPDFADAHYNLAGIYMQLGQKDQAIGSLNKSADLYQQQGRYLEGLEYKRLFIDYFENASL